ncbi:unnamed protein product, partial [Brassica rapa]
WVLSSTPSSSQIFPTSSIYANMDYLFWRKNNRDPLELVRYAESECQAWYSAKDSTPTPPQTHMVEETQVLSLENICMVDGSWTSMDQCSGIGWVWKDDRGKIQLMGTKNVRRHETSLHSELEASRWAMESMLQHSTCQKFGTDCKDLIAMVNDPQAWPNFSTELEVIQILKMCFPDFKIQYFPRVQNGIADSLARNARSFH